MHARFLVSADEIVVLESARRGAPTFQREEWTAVAGALSGALAAVGGLKLPSLAGVQDVLAELAQR